MITEIYSIIILRHDEYQSLNICEIFVKSSYSDQMKDHANIFYIKNNTR